MLPPDVGRWGLAVCWLLAVDGWLFPAFVIFYKAMSDATVFRILDANLNRSREACRVLDDAVERHVGRDDEFSHDERGAAAAGNRAPSSRSGRRLYTRAEGGEGDGRGPDLPCARGRRRSVR